MNKKNYLSLFAVIAVAMFSISFASCGSDDDDISGSNSSALVGIWTQFHEEEAFVGYYIGIKLDANGDAAYSEWSYGKTPVWDGGGKWIVKDNVLTVTVPNGSVVYSSFFTLSSDGKTITFAGDTTRGHFETIKGEFIKQ